MNPAKKDNNVTVLESKKVNTDKSGIVKDDNGYYKMLLGAFNTYNFSGIFYRIKNPSDLLKDGTIWNRRITNGIYKGEKEHPDYKGMSREEIIQRTIKIDSDRVCAHIKSVELVDTGRCEKGWDGYNITLVYGWVKPTGPFGPELQEALDNPDMNVPFSVRSLVSQKIVGSTVVRDVVDVCAHDWVYENGISIATQWNAAGIESIGDNHDIGVCIDGACSTGLKNMIAGIEDIDCNDARCLLEVVDSFNNVPAVFDI